MKKQKEERDKYKEEEEEEVGCVNTERQTDWRFLDQTRRMSW